MDFETLGGEPAGADFQAIQNLCDLHQLGLVENKYNLGAQYSGYTVYKRGDGPRASMTMKYNDTIEEWIDCINWFLDKP